MPRQCSKQCVLSKSTNTFFSNLAVSSSSSSRLLTHHQTIKVRTHPLPLRSILYNKILLFFFVLYSFLLYHTTTNQSTTTDNQSTTTTTTTAPSLHHHHRPEHHTHSSNNVPPKRYVYFCITHSRTIPDQQSHQPARSQDDTSTHSVHGSAHAHYHPGSHAGGANHLNAGPPSPPYPHRSASYTAPRVPDQRMAPTQSCMLFF